jgi:hypothetical protein
MTTLAFYFIQLDYFEDSKKREKLAVMYSNKRTTHTTEWTQEEAAAALIALQKEYEDAVKKIRHSIFKKATELGWLKMVEGKQDYTEWNKWMLEKSPEKKELWKHNYKELKFLNKQISAVLDYYNTSAKVDKAHVVDQQHSPTST